MLKPLLAALALPVLVAGVSTAVAQVAGYPSKQARIVVPFPAGGSTDLLARLMGQKMSEAWGRPVVVENRPGGSGSIAAEFAARSAPDGHTIFLGTSGDMSVNPSLMRKLGYDPEKDFDPVGQLALSPLVVTTHPSLPIRTVKELLDTARAKPGSLSYLSVGEGSAAHLAGEMFKKTTGTDIVHVPYKGGAPQVAALLAGLEPQFGYVVMGTAIPHLQAGKLRALALTTARRARMLPDVPTLAEAGVPGFDIGNWFAAFVPAGTPKEIVAFLNAENARILRLPDVAARMADLGFETTLSSPEELARHLASEIAKYRKVIADAGIARQ
ncbi:MAG: tripartite tricarboxylate transporter substrate binding protein [Burkholderiales bacterium]|nr:tripartite tricarboxylate transporter substrate binding protein [Burkholderiales bacterium]